MKTRILAILLLFTALNVFGTSDAIKVLANKLYLNPREAHAEISRMSESEKAEMLAYIKGPEDSIYEPSYKESLLLEFEDVEAIRKYVKKFRDTDGFDGWSELAIEAQSPIAIEMLAHDLFRKEEVNTKDMEPLDEKTINSNLSPNEKIGVIITPPHQPFSFHVSLLVTRILWMSPHFNDQVRAWAKPMDQGAPDYVKLRETMQKWWGENEEHFRKKDYKAVQPLTETTVAGATSSPSQPSSTAAPTPTLQTNPNPAKEPPPKSFLLPAAITIVALLGTALFLRRRK